MEAGFPAFYLDHPSVRISIWGKKRQRRGFTFTGCNELGRASSVGLTLPPVSLLYLHYLSGFGCGLQQREP